jgi:hypothetical protein
LPLQISFFFAEFDPTLIPELGKMGFLGAPYHVRKFIKFDNFLNGNVFVPLFFV